MTIQTKASIIVIALLVLFSFIYAGIFNDLQDSRSELVTQSITLDSVRSRNEILERVAALDETIITRYQKSVQSCRNATSHLIDGDYTSALIEAKDVGETEEDVGPMLNERQKLLNGTNAELL